MANEEKIFHDLLKLVGTEIEIKSSKIKDPLKGKISNVMFDSFIFDSSHNRFIIRFEDLESLSGSNNGRIK